MVHLPNAIKEKARAIRLVVFDVDGVLTDGTLSYSASGEEVKHFNVKDGVGIKLLNVFDIDTAIISAKDSAPLAKRAADLGINRFFPGTKDKWPVLADLMDELMVDPSEVCYVGDDVIDHEPFLRKFLCSDEGPGEDASIAGKSKESMAMTCEYSERQHASEGNEFRSEKVQSPSPIQQRGSSKRSFSRFSSPEQDPPESQTDPEIKHVDHAVSGFDQCKSFPNESRLIRARLLI